MKVLVTGAASGLGLALVSRLQEAGYGTYAFDIADDSAEDVANPDLAVDGALDVLINCAGINRNEWFEDITREGFDKVMGVNAWGMVAMTQAVLPQLKASAAAGRLGVVINIVSNASHIPMTSSLAYNASKAAAAMITRQMAHELTPKYGITVFSVSPNKLAGTGMSKQIEDNVVKTRGWTAEYAREYQRKALMHGRETDPEALANFIVSLLDGDHHKYLSGCDIPYGK